MLGGAICTNTGYSRRRTGPCEREKMVNQDNTKIGVGAIAVFGTALVAYMLYKQWKKRKDGINYLITKSFPYCLELFN